MKKMFLMTLSLMLFAFSGWSQKTVTGVVLDENGSPLPGATIVEKNTSNGVSTDFDGNYSIEVAEGATLEFSFVGYENMSVLVEASDSYNVTLSASNELEEIVVTALGFKRKKDEDISSGTLVKSEQIVRSGETGLLQGIAGKTSGLLITQSSGDPGAGAFIQIRGQNTVLGNSSPLVIVDGVPISNSSFGSSTAGVVQQSRLNDIPASDIESMTVLKGAAAAAVWGSGAANGAIIIQTKRGNATGGSNLNVNFSSSVSFDEVNREHAKQGIFGQGRGGVWDSNASGLSWGDKIADRSGAANAVDQSGAYFVGDITGQTYYPITSKNSRNIYNGANRDMIFRTGVTQNYGLSVNYSGENSDTFISYSRLDQKGVINGLSDYVRNTFRVNNTNKLTSRITT